MRLNSTIYFDGESLVIDNPIKIIYSGPLKDDSPEEIYMHYGYGLLWDNLQEIKLIKGINGYESDIIFTEFGDVNFCFRSNSGKWDNNGGQNYAVTIDKPKIDIPVSDSLALVEIPTLKKSYLIRKKIRISLYRLITFVGKLFTGKILRRKLKKI